MVVVELVAMTAPAPQALTSLGSDLTFSVSFALALELREQAAVLHISQSQLIATLLLLTFILGRLPIALHGIEEIVSSIYGQTNQNDRVYVKETKEGEEDERGKGGGTYRHVSAFVMTFVDIARRITASLLVQIVARGVVADQPLRASRVISLLTVTIFFIFLQAGGGMTEPSARAKKHNP